MLSAEHSVATGTVRKAMRALKAEGLFFTVAGYGTFVSGWGGPPEPAEPAKRRGAPHCIASATGAVRAGGSRPHGWFRSPPYSLLSDASGQWHDQSASGGPGS